MPGSRKTRPSGPFICLLLLAAAAFVAGCSTAKWEGDSAPGGRHLGDDASRGPAPRERREGGAGRRTGFAYCQICHGAGTNFAGGSSGVSCYTCHGVSAPHSPAPWRASAGSTYTHTNTNPANARCARLRTRCHRTTRRAIRPTRRRTRRLLQQHTVSRVGRRRAPCPVQRPDPLRRDRRHVPGGLRRLPRHLRAVWKVGPACQTCHVAASPLTALTCTSCHASPPNGGAPAGAAYPNVPGAHATHIALNSAGTPIACDTCHNGLGSGTLNHYNRAKSRVPPGDVAFPATYNAATGASSFDNSAALSCSNVSCHGGQATPNWQTGAINVNTQCTSCHAFGPSLGNLNTTAPTRASTTSTRSTRCARIATIPPRSR